MPQVRLAMAQINPVLGALEFNSKLILESSIAAAQQNCDLVVFPEMALSGYPIEDLALDSGFLGACQDELDSLAKELGEQCPDLHVLVGHPSFASSPSKWAIAENSASLLFQGEVVSRYAKHHLPNYSVFDEYRTFVPGNRSHQFTLGGIRFGTLICEDIWQSGGPRSALSANNIDVALVLNGSPFELTKSDERLALVQQLASEQSVAVVYVNLVGAQDDLVFDGDSFAISPSGDLIARSPQFETSLEIIDFDSESIRCKREPARRLHYLEQAYSALVLGLKDYVAKNNFSQVILGLSGGIDSALTATIASDAIGSENVFGLLMPSKFSSQHSISDAKELAENLGVSYQIENISNLVNAFEAQLELSDIAKENLQARVRAILLMSLSNTHGQLVLSTSNKSELLVGYSTIYGDSVGGFSPLKDVEKSLVWDLANWRNQKAKERGEHPPIPENSITKEPSAELRPDQKDVDSLPPYEVLDEILKLVVEDRTPKAELISQGFDPEIVSQVLNLASKAEWKRRQGAIGPRITKLAFGRERRVPITNRFQ
jgi:NAD+ synthase (glutamine-hydrolysing)